MPSAQQLWADKYAKRFADAKFREDSLREEAFIDSTHTVYGERVRTMTPEDLLILQGISSPLVYGGREVGIEDCMQFLWLLHRENRGGWFMRAFRRGRMMKRILRRRSADPVNDITSEILDYIDAMFLDAPRGGKGDTKPVGLCWLATTMVRLGGIAARDPLTGNAWGTTPLPRVWQYIKASRMMEEGSKFKDYSPSDAVMSEWMEEVNAQNTKERTDGI